MADEQTSEPASQPRASRPLGVGVTVDSNIKFTIPHTTQPPRAMVKNPPRSSHVSPQMYLPQPSRYLFSLNHTQFGYVFPFTHKITSKVTALPIITRLVQMFLSVCAGGGLAVGGSRDE